MTALYATPDGLLILQHGAARWDLGTVTVRVADEDEIDSRIADIFDEAGTLVAHVAYQLDAGHAFFRRVDPTWDAIDEEGEDILVLVAGMGPDPAWRHRVLELWGRGIPAR